MVHYHIRRSSFDRTFGFDPEDEDDYTVVHVKIDKRRTHRFQERLRIEAARRKLVRLVTSDAYRNVRRDQKGFCIERLRITASKSKWGIGA